MSEGFASRELTGLVCHLVTQLQELAGTEECLGQLKPDGNVQVFIDWVQVLLTSELQRSSNNEKRIIYEPETRPDIRYLMVGFLVAIKNTK